MEEKDLTPTKSLPIYSAVRKLVFTREMERFVCRYNSYSGFMVWKRTYAIRCKIWNKTPEYIKNFVYINSNKSSIALKQEYKTLTKYKKR